MSIRPSPQTDRVIALVNFLSSDAPGGASLSEIARRLKLSKQALYPMLAALTDTGFVLRHPLTKAFQLGPSLIPVGEAAARALPVLELARAAARRLHDALGVMVHIYAISGGFATAVEILDSGTHDFPMLRVGHRFRLAAPGGALSMAWAPAAAVRDWAGVGEDESLPEALERSLAAIRARGYSIELLNLAPEIFAQFMRELKNHIHPREEQVIVDAMSKRMLAHEQTMLDEVEATQSYDVASVSAPVFDRRGNASLIIGLSAFTQRLTGAEIESLGTMLLKETRAIR
jgi:DNA-binding IclR family transcriptional regulator